MAWRVIRAHRGKDCDVVIHARDEEGCCKETFIFRGFRPRFYVLENETVKDAAITGYEPGYTSMYGERLKRVYLRNPSDTPRVRELFSKHFQADIPYARVFLISKGVTAWFDFVGLDDEDIIPVTPPEGVK